MSAIALKWVASIKVGNQTAKQLLQFYASHNFNKPGFEFKNKTLAQQLEVSERAIRDAHKLLIDKGLIKRVPQYGKDGRQLSTITYLEIPDEVVDNFFKIGGGEELAAGGGGTSCRGGEELAAALNNNNINNKKNKRESAREKALPPKALSLNFEPDEKRQEKLKETSEKCGLTTDELITKFKNVYTLNKKKSLDWQIELENFLINEKPAVQKKKPITQEAPLARPESQSNAFVSIEESIRRDRAYRAEMNKRLGLN